MAQASAQAWLAGIYSNFTITVHVTVHVCNLIVLQYCCRSYMLWDVNNGGGYPFPNGTDIASYVSASDFKLLDTNGDGEITQADDPYAPYYPVSPPLLA